MRIYAALLSGMAVVALAASVGLVVPAETLALGSGVFLGALAEIPMSMLIGAVLPAPTQVDGDSQSLDKPVAGHPPYPRVDGYSPVRDYPPVIIVNPADFRSRHQSLTPGELSGFPVLEAQRQFHVIGEVSQP
jgi:hypothetical protein